MSRFVASHLLMVPTELPRPQLPKGEWAGDNLGNERLSAVVFERHGVLLAPYSWVSGLTLQPHNFRGSYTLDLPMPKSDQPMLELLDTLAWIAIFTQCNAMIGIDITIWGDRVLLSAIAVNTKREAPK